MTTKNNSGYSDFIEKRFKIVDKESQVVPFTLNPVQKKYLLEDMTGRDLILKARQQGFSSLILAIFTAEFLLKPNIRNVIVADVSENAQELLDRVKKLIRFYEEITQTKVPLKYNSKYELYNLANDSRYTVGTADNIDFGRSKTINNLHLSELAFYPNAELLLAGAGEAVVPTGRIIIETTANGFNYLKRLWDICRLDGGAFKALFYGASESYTQEYLEEKKKALGRYFPQEYPETAEEAFITSGDCYFDKEAIKFMLDSSGEMIPFQFQT